MKIAIFEIGDYHEGADIVRVFSSVEKAIENIPLGFKSINSLPGDYADEINERWLAIKEYEVEK